jgi:hypothetical protein
VEIRLEKQIKRQGPGRGSPALKFEKKNTPIRFHPGKDLPDKNDSFFSTYSSPFHGQQVFIYSILNNCKTGGELAAAG